MGTDIHMIAQVHKEGKWETVQLPYTKWWEEDKERVHLGYHWFHGRNYDLFGILADVRNGTWGEPTPSIAPDRGLPDDLEYDESAAGQDDDTIWLGDHSFTWLTLKELLDFDWSQPVKRSAMVSPGEHERMVVAGEARPQAFCASCSSGKYVRVNWTETCAEVAGEFFSKWLPKLQELGKPEDVRLVMGFDS